MATLLSSWAAYGARRHQGARSPSIDKLTGPGLVSDLRRSARRHDPRARRQGQGRRHRASSAPTSSTIRRCARSTNMRAGPRATRTPPPPTRALAGPSTRSCRATRWCRKASKRPRPARSCRRWSTSPQAGAAEALYGIGATLTRRGGEDLALVYLQLALYLQPNHPMALLSLADLYEIGEEAADGDQDLRADAGVARR